MPAEPVAVGLVDGPIDTRHPALAGASIHPLDGARVCLADQGVGCRHGTFIAGLLLGRTEGSKASPPPQTGQEPHLINRPIFCDSADFSGCPLISVERLAEALREVVDAGARVVNLSVGLEGGGVDPAALHAAYEHARRAGAVVVVAAGNQGRDGIHPLLEHPWPIPVAAAGNDGRPLALSNRGPILRRQGLLAPGDGVSGPRAGGGWQTMAGTSAAAALVSAAAARLWARHPEADAETLRRALLRPAIPRGGPLPPMLNERESDMNLTEQHAQQPIPAPLLPAADATPNAPQPPVDAPLDAAAEAHAVPAQASVADQPTTAAIQAPAPQPAAVEPPPPTLLPQSGCAAAAAMMTDPDYLYAIGHLRPTFPSLDVEREFEAAAAESGLGEKDFHGVLSQEKYRYLANAVCWVLAINNVDSYVVRPRSPAELNDCIDSLKVAAGAVEPPYSVVIGPRGPRAPAALCNGLELPMVLLNQLYFFDFNALIEQMSKQATIESESVVAVLKAMEIKPNPGAGDEDRALNYIACRFPEIYEKATQMKDPKQAPAGRHFLRAIETKAAPVSGGRRIVDVIFHYQQYDTGEQTSWYCGIDVSGQFPFINTKLRIFIPSQQ